MPPSGDLKSAVRDADGALRGASASVFNAFAAEQWLAADGDGRDPVAARVAEPACDRLGCVGDLPEGQSLSLVLDRAAFEEDCARATIIVSALTAPAACGPARVYDERRLGETGAVGLVWTPSGYVETAARGALEDRPWSPAPRRPRDDRLRRPGSHGADPADGAMAR